MDQGKVHLSDERQRDGDSFGIEIDRPKGDPVLRTYRFYGVDCPESDEKDGRLQSRVTEQAKHFGCDPTDVFRHGKEAARFTEQLLKRGKPRILTRGKLGERVQKQAGRPQRYYAMVEVTAQDGERRMLHELLVENGHARAYGTAAAWPPKEEDKEGKEEAKKKFKEDMKKLEQKAKRAGLGVWARPEK